MKISFFTLGCKVNQYETETLKNLFFENGWTIVNKSSFADVYVINSCTVTSIGEKKTKQSIHKFKLINPNAIIVITGCFPQAFPEKMQQLKNADIITGTTNRSNLPNIVNQFLNDRKRVIDISPHKQKDSFENLTINKFSNKTRAFIKIQDGCNRYCSYCIIPKARGFVRSKPLDILQKELNALAEKGYKEIVFVGINLSLYGTDFKNNNINIIDAIKIAANIDKIQRIRLGSIDPDILTKNDILELSQETKFCPQFHLSLQSGSNSVLKRMGRHYDIDLYKNLISSIFKTFKNPAITTDIMVGFPGETKDEFNESLKFIEETNFSRIHIFPYSIRPGTKAAKMSDQITKQEKQIRIQQMKNIAQKTTQKFMKNQINKVHEVLYEKKENDIFSGYTKNYIPVKTKSNSNLCSQIKCVRIESCEDNFCVGKLTNDI